MPRPMRLSTQPSAVASRHTTAAKRRKKPTLLHLPEARQLAHWRQVCVYLDSQPYRAVRYPYPTNPPISVKLLKRLAQYRLVRHYDDCSWRLARTWQVTLAYLEGKRDRLDSEQMPPAHDEMTAVPFIADTGVDTVYESLFGQGLPKELIAACDYYKELAQEEDATVETPWRFFDAPLSMFKSGVGTSGQRNHGVSWSWVLRNANVMLLLRRTPLAGLLGSVRFSAECLWSYGYKGALDGFRSDLAALLNLFEGDIAGIQFQLSQIHLCADVANFALQPSDLSRILTRSLKKAVHIPSLSDELTADPSEYDPDDYDPFGPDSIVGIFEDDPWNVDAVPPEWDAVPDDFFADGLPDDDEEGDEDDESETGETAEPEDEREDDESDAGEEEGAAVYLWGQRASGFVFSPGAELSAGWYNKELEERLSGKTWMRPIHEAGGWQKGMALTRIEPRFRRDVLRELAPLAGMDPATVERWFDDPWTAGEHLQDLWAVFAGLPPEADTAPDVTYRGWMRLAIPVPDQANHARWPTDPVWHLIQRAQFTAIPPTALKRFPNRAPNLDQINAELYGLLKLRAVLRDAYLGTSMTLSLEVGKFVAEMDEVDATSGRDFAEEVREKARMMGKPVPLREDGMPRVKQATKRKQASA